MFLCVTENYDPVLFIGGAWEPVVVADYFFWNQRLFVKLFWILHKGRCWIYKETKKITFLPDDPTSTNNLFIPDWSNTYVFEGEFANNNNVELPSLLLDMLKEYRELKCEFSLNPEIEAIYQQLKILRNG